MKNKILVTEEKQKHARQALMNGFKVVLPVILFGIVFTLIFRFVLKLSEKTSILGAFTYTFFTLALSEELSKGYMTYSLIKKNAIEYSWFDLIVYMVIVSIGFDILESALFALDTSPVQILIRGIAMPHIAYGFFMGYFAGKAMKTKNKFNYVLALIIPWILHGAYDFCLKPIVAEDRLFVMVTAILLALSNLIIAVLMIVFLNKSKNDPVYTETIK